MRGVEALLSGMLRALSDVVKHHALGSLISNADRQHHALGLVTTRFGRNRTGGSRARRIDTMARRDCWQALDTRKADVQLEVVESVNRVREKVRIAAKRACVAVKAINIVCVREINIFSK